jgi:glycosyltransferase involved in cell wall biosynthesis
MLKVLGISYGSYSGSRDSLFSELETNGCILVKTIDSKLRGPYKLINWNNFLISYLRTIYLLRGMPAHKNQWSTLAHKRPWIWYLKTKICEKELRKWEDQIDVILQIGNYNGLTTTKLKKPYMLYADGSIETTEDNYPFAQLWWSESEKARRKKLDEKVFQNADKIFTWSNYVKNTILENYDVEKGKIKTIYAGVNLKWGPDFEKNFGNKIILFVGIDFHRKGGWTLVEAFKEVKKKIPDAKLIIVGASPKIQEEGILVKGRIPKVRHQELLRLYENASLYVMPSIQENLGLVFLEAMAYKTPCIGSTVGGIPEIIKHGKSGYLVKPNDPRELANKIIELLENEELMKRMGEEGQSLVKKYFTWDLVAKKMVKEFDKLF